MIKKALVVPIVIFQLLTSFAQEDGYLDMLDIEQFKIDAKKVASNTKSISSDFIQEKVLSIMDETIVSEGKFLFKKENSIRWEYQKPFTYLIIIKDGEIFIKDDNKENKFDMKSNKTFKGINDMIVNSVSGNLMDDENYDISYYESATQYMVQLIPKDEKMKEFLSVIRVYFNRKDYSVEKVKMIEQSEDYTSITFTNRVMNEEIPDEKFLFK